MEFIMNFWSLQNSQYTFPRMNPKINYAHFILFLRECFKTFFGEYYPHELILFIILLSRDDIQIYCADTRTYIIKNNKYMCWKSQRDDPSISYGTPQSNPELPKFVYYSGYQNTFTGLTAEGDLYIWGNLYELEKSQTYPQKRLSNIKNISCGYNAIFAVDKQDKIYVFGRNTYGQLGVGDYDNRNTFTMLELNDKNINMMICLNACTIFLFECGEIYMCGSNEYGELGLGDHNNRNIPTKLNLNNIIAIAIGCVHSIALSKHGQLFVWGDNNVGQLGLGDIFNKNIPQELKLDETSDIISISCTMRSTFALTKLGDVWCWGMQAGYEFSYTPQKIKINAKLISISCGTYYTFTTDVYGEIYYCDSYIYEPKRLEFC